MGKKNKKHKEKSQSILRKEEKLRQKVEQGTRTIKIIRDGKLITVAKGPS